MTQNSDFPNSGVGTSAQSGQLHLHGGPVESVEIIGHIVKEPIASQMHALHLAEVITYKDGFQDVVGYFPEGRGLFHDGDRMYAETKLDGETKAEYLKNGRSNFSRGIDPKNGQTLDQFVAKQKEIWEGNNRHPMRYDFDGNNPVLANSNAALVNSIVKAGQADFAKHLVFELEPSDRLHLLESYYGLNPEAASFLMGWERFRSGEAWGAGSGQEYTQDQVIGLAPTPPDQTFKGLAFDQVGELVKVLELGGIDEARDSVRSLMKNEDLLEHVPPRSGDQVEVLWQNRSNAEAVFLVDAPFKPSGLILSVDDRRVLMNVASGQLLTLRTDDLLYGLSDPARAKALGDLKALDHQSVVLTVDKCGFKTEPMTQAALEVYHASTRDAHESKLHVMVLNPNGSLVSQTISAGDVPKSGPLEVQGELIVQQFGNRTIYSRVDEMLAHAREPERLREFLERADQTREHVRLGLDGQGMVVAMDAHEIAQARAHERSLSLGLERA